MIVIVMSYGKLRLLWWMFVIRNILLINYNIVFKFCLNLLLNILVVFFVIKGYVILSGCFFFFSVNKKFWCDFLEFLE